MPSETDLLRSLDDDPRTPSTIDIHRAITSGKRRRARRSAGYAGAAAVTAVAVAGASVAGGVFTDDGASRNPAATPAKSAPAKAEPGAVAVAPPNRCRLEKLPVPGDVSMALVAGADPTGRYIVGRSYPKGGGYQAVIWHDGKGRNVAMPGDSEEQLTDVNSAGTAIGWSYDASGQVPYVYRDGKVSKLPGVKQAEPRGINDAGAIVAGDGAELRDVLLWKSPTAQPTRLPLPAGATHAMAGDIDEDGTVVGTIDMRTPYVWLPDGSHHALTLPTVNGKPLSRAGAFGIRNGWVTGTAGGGGLARGGAGTGKDKAQEPLVGVRWNLRTGEVQVVGELQDLAGAVNAQGWLVGSDKQGRAVLVAGDTPVLLPPLAKKKQTNVSNIPSTLSDDGRIVAGQSDDDDANDTIKAVVWHCS